MSTISESDGKQLQDLIDGISTAMLTSRSEGQLRSRPMASQGLDDDGKLWFLTVKDTEKADEISADSQVNVAYSEMDKNRFVSISGSAELVDDLEKKKVLWSPVAKLWFTGPEDPNLVLLCVNIEGAEYWDGPSNKMVAAFKWAKALVTGDDKILSKNETLDPSVSVR